MPCLWIWKTCDISLGGHAGLHAGQTVTWQRRTTRRRDYDSRALRIKHYGVCSQQSGKKVLKTQPFAVSLPPWQLHPFCSWCGQHASAHSIGYYSRLIHAPCLVVQFSSVTQLCLTLGDPMDCSTPGFPVHHQLPELTQTHIHWVSDIIQPLHSLPSPSPSTLSLSQHQGLFQWVSFSYQLAKVLEFQLQHPVIQFQSFQWTPRTDLL